MFFVGAIFGTLVFGAFSDRFGRVPGLVATNFTAGVSGALSALSTNLTSFIITRFIFGMAYNLQTTLAIIYLSECVGAEYRGMVVNLPLATSFSLGMAILPWISWGAGDWKITALATSLPMLFALVYIVADVPESSRWLQQTGQLDKMLQNMRKVAKENRKTVTEDTWKQFEAAARSKYEGERSKPAPGLRQLLKHPRLRTRMLVLMFSTAILLFLFDITSRSTDFDVDIYIAHTLLAVSEAPADLLTWLLVDTLGRRWTITGATTLTSGAGLALAALLYVGTAPPAASTIAAVFCRFTTTIAVNVLMTMSMELIPTDVRSRAFSLVQVTGHVGSLCSTLILYLKHVARGLPQLVLGLLALVGALSVSFLPETRNRPLPDTLEEGEQFGRDQRWLECYCGDQKIEDTRDQVEETERQGVKNPALDCSDDMETHL